MSTLSSSPHLCVFSYSFSLSVIPCLSLSLFTCSSLCFAPRLPSLSWVHVWSLIPLSLQFVSFPLSLCQAHVSWGESQCVCVASCFILEISCPVCFDFTFASSVPFVTNYVQLCPNLLSSLWLIFCPHLPCLLSCCPHRLCFHVFIAS